MKNGIIIIDKEQGFTSFDVVAKLRGICGQKKIGHTGTLDPDATGVLPVCLGNATKVCDMLTDSDKTYQAVLLLGKETDTQDMTGTVLAEKPVTADEQMVSEAIRSFCGKQMQIPPMYSALKVNGQKLCDLARAGKTVERKARQITVYDIVICEMDLPRVTIEVHCSKGTYIRTLCHDIGQKLGCGGCMESLRRTRAAGFTIEQALTLSQVQQAKEEGRLEDLIRPVDTVFSEYPALMVKATAQQKLLNGNALCADDFVFVQEEVFVQSVRIYDSNSHFTAVYGFQKEKGCFKPVKMFLS